MQKTKGTIGFVNPLGAKETTVSFLNLRCLFLFFLGTWKLKLNIDIWAFY